MLKREERSWADGSNRVLLPGEVRFDPGSQPAARLCLGRGQVILFGFLREGADVRGRVEIAYSGDWLFSLKED